MAVGSIDNKIKGSNAKNKHKNKRRRISSKKKEIISELIIELEALATIKEQRLIKKREQQ